jgi:DNA invertase Pin-like site-specific DNA recombinase
MLIGYARVSSTGQSLDLQMEALRAAGCEKIHAEKKSGTSTTERAELARALDQIRIGDTMVVTRLDRLARSVSDLHAIVDSLSHRGADFRCLQQGGVDTTTSTGKLMLAILGAVAAFENDIRRERQRDGIEKAKALGRYRGRIHSIDRSRICALKLEGMGPSEIARTMGISRMSVYRALDGERATNE